MVAKWEAYLLHNHSCFAPSDTEHFLEGTRWLAALEKATSVYLRTDFCKDCRRFLDELAITVLSTVVVRSLMGQGLSCFCVEIIVGGDDYSGFYLFGQLVEGFFILGWEKGAEFAAVKAEFHTFLSEQRQVEKSGSLRAPIIDVFSFCGGQTGFCFRRNLYPVGKSLGIAQHIAHLVVLTFSIIGTR